MCICFLVVVLLLHVVLFVCFFVCLCVCVCVCLCVCVCACMRAYMRACVCLHMHVLEGSGWWEGWGWWEGVDVRFHEPNTLSSFLKSNLSSLEKMMSCV